MSRARASAPLRIHRVIARLNVGGPALHVVNLAGGLRDHGFDTRLVAGRIGPDEGDMTWYARERGVAVTEVPSMARAVDPVGDAATLWRLYRIFRRDRPQVVHTHTAKAGTLGRLAARAAGVPVVVHTFHGHVLGGDYFPAAVTRAYLEIERTLARLTDRLVVLTGRQRGEMADELRVAPAERFSVVPLGLELDGLAGQDRARARTEGRRRMGLPADVPVVGIVGRLVPIKDHELALEVLAALHRRLRADPGPGMHPGSPVLAVVGGGSPEREAALRRLAEVKGVGEAVRWLGWQTDLGPLYAAMDALLLTSKDEGTPVAILEALAAGTPVVTVAVGGIPEVLAGLDADHRLVPERDAGTLAAALAGVLSREAAPDGPPHPARRRVAEAWSVARLCRDLASLYRSELALRGIRTS